MTPIYTDRLQRLARYLVASLDSDSCNISYVGVALDKAHSVSWIKHIKEFLRRCLDCIETLKPGIYTWTWTKLLIEQASH